MVYQKREELEAELHISTRENCLQEPHVKKRYKWRNHLFYTPGVTPKEREGGC
jgi:hypothetical protein